MSQNVAMILAVAVLAAMCGLSGYVGYRIGVARGSRPRDPGKRRGRAKLIPMEPRSRPRPPEPPTDPGDTTVH